LRALWPALGPDFVEVRRPARSPRLSKPLSANFAGSRPDGSRPALEPAADRSHLPIADRSLEPQTPEFSWVQETSRHIGTVVHAALERFRSAGELPTRDELQKQADVFGHQLRRHGVPERDIERAIRTVMQALLRTLDDERGRWIFSPSHRSAQSELALTGMRRRLISRT